MFKCFTNKSPKHFEYFSCKKILIWASYGDACL